MARTVFPPQRREQTGDPALDRIQGLATDLASQLRLCPFIVGKLKSVRFASGVAKVVNHKLGAPAACIIVRQNYDSATASVRLSESNAAAQVGLDANNQLKLIADANCDLDLWFYPKASKAIDVNTGESA